MTAPNFILTFSCQDQVGIVATVTGKLAELEGFILDSQQYADLDQGRFFMRIVFQKGGDAFPEDTAALRAAMAPIAKQFDFRWSLTDSEDKPRIVIAVSQGTHCLNALLHRWKSGFLPIEPVAVISNHETCRSLTEWHGVPFHYLPVTNENRAEQEAAILDLMEGSNAEYLVLARYMQILSDDFSTKLSGRCINIHHSFLPGFKGAKPYHQAHERGVKLIGATAHFVTPDLDEGPIIEQQVERVDHRATADFMARIGRDIEAQTLARAIHWVAERRVILNGKRTVVFR
ncbi:formyltetrahydrofolate deformylase [Parasphingopyxis marina]|uniref:Formyltetrahydrofolate deformylase n=1 Tax=Parasphingopyxis marina TaxID=2761622 RepID=A0A842HWR3_9SPHN|nr:formyltetrahydrofolate deformylase [Parasphingopyxis marina]MBC2778568.1 formyltetrahydrofolate deformylase [Parasphingopyxis marina]